MKKPKAIKITIVPGNPAGKDWNEKLGDGFMEPLAGEWSDDACHKFMCENHPGAHSYEILYHEVENTSCYWPD